MPLYEVKYDRLPKDKTKVKDRVYAEGHWRTISMIADSEDEAKEIAAKRLAKQFPEDGSANAHSNYKLQGVSLK